MRTNRIITLSEYKYYNTKTNLYNIAEIKKLGNYVELKEIKSRDVKTLDYLGGGYDMMILMGISLSSVVKEVLSKDKDRTIYIHALNLAYKNGSKDINPFYDNLILGNLEHCEYTNILLSGSLESIYDYCDEHQRNFLDSVETLLNINKNSFDSVETADYTDLLKKVKDCKGVKLNIVGNLVYTIKNKRLIFNIRK